MDVVRDISPVNISQADRCSASITGRDRQAWIKGTQLAYSLRELSQVSCNLPSEANRDATALATIVNNTNWGLFNVAM